jgi:equilibrative nucleoside transporter 1/2/3
MTEQKTGKKFLEESFRPTDQGYLAYIIMFYEGVGNLFPWNAFITASAYFSTRFCGTSFEESFENYFSITFTLSQTIGLALSIFFQNKLTLQQKITWPLLAYSTIFGVTTLLVTQNSIDPSFLFWITLLSLCLCGLCGAVLSSGLFGLGAMLPAAYTGALMNGQGLAGLVVAASSMLTMLASDGKDFCDDAENDDSDCPQTVDFSALSYFIIATVVLLTCILAYYTLKRLPFTL